MEWIWVHTKCRYQLTIHKRFQIVQQKPFNFIAHPMLITFKGRSFDFCVWWLYRVVCINDTKIQHVKQIILVLSFLKKHLNFIYIKCLYSVASWGVHNHLSLTIWVLGLDLLYVTYMVLHFIFQCPFLILATINKLDNLNKQYLIPFYTVYIFKWKEWFKVKHLLERLQIVVIRKNRISNNVSTF